MVRLYKMIHYKMVLVKRKFKGKPQKLIAKQKRIDYISKIRKKKQELSEDYAALPKGLIG